MYRQSEKNLLNGNISFIRPHNTAHLRLRSVGEFGASQQISTDFAPWLRYCSNVAHQRSTKLCTMFVRFLGWYTVYTFLGLLPVTEFCRLQNSLRIHGLRSPILAALLHGSRAVGVSQCLRHGITELLERAPPILGRAAIMLVIGPNFSYFCIEVISD